MLVVTPVLAPHAADAAAFGYRLMSYICHQDPHRSFFVGGYPMAACIRCTSIYFAFFAGALFSPFLGPRLSINARIWWAVASVPMLADVVLDVAGWHASTAVTRMMTGSLFGLLGGLILVPVLTEALVQRFGNRNPTLEKCT